jgi:hypothetical protein
VDATQPLAQLAPPTPDPVPGQATVSVVTADQGPDIGPFCAWLGRDLRDGLTVRAVDPGRLRRHASPGRWLGAPADAHLPTAPDQHLLVLPSAWQNPDTNLGVAYAPRIVADFLNTHDALFNDLYTLGLHGVSPNHRLTVQGAPLKAVLPWGLPPGVEAGDLAAQARDSVLRGSPVGARHVLIEAGDGMTHLNALAAVGLSPWTAAIDVLDLWIVIDASRLYTGGQPGNLWYPPVAQPDRNQITRVATTLGGAAQPFIASNGGGRHPHGGFLHSAPTRMWLAVQNAQAVVPALDGITEADVNAVGSEPTRLTDQADRDLVALLNTLEDVAQCEVGAISTTSGISAPWIDFRDRR